MPVASAAFCSSNNNSSGSSRKPLRILLLLEGDALLLDFVSLARCVLQGLLRQQLPAAATEGLLLPGVPIEAAVAKCSLDLLQQEEQRMEKDRASTAVATYSARVAQLVQSLQGNATILRAPADRGRAAPKAPTAAVASNKTALRRCCREPAITVVCCTSNGKLVQQLLPLQLFLDRVTHTAGTGGSSSSPEAAEAVAAAAAASMLRPCHLLHMHSSNAADFAAAVSRIAAAAADDAFEMSTAAAEGLCGYTNFAPLTADAAAEQQAVSFQQPQRQPHELSQVKLLKSFECMDIPALRRMHGLLQQQHEAGNEEDEAPTICFFLQEPLVLQGRVVRGFGRGSSLLGIPTANLLLQQQEEAENAYGAAVDLPLVPGIYFGWAAVLDENEHPGVGEPPKPGGPWKAVLSFGFNPHFANQNVTIEPHLLTTGFGDLRGRALRLAICGFIRSEAAFASFCHSSSRGSALTRHGSRSSSDGVQALTRVYTCTYSSMYGRRGVSSNSRERALTGLRSDDTEASEELQESARAAVAAVTTTAATAAACRTLPSETKQHKGGPSIALHTLMVVQRACLQVLRRLVLVLVLQVHRQGGTVWAGEVAGGISEGGGR
ncbi:hypothetical protein cyc_05110 [Cyclospora cayetanensis]|uniref:riboflavin kinase n=1 Tax=Cyclospora cayetanensis TaxID=88456 RepID=A0A1D3CZ89_9EIME|nr:hypothetical protein cyc_05110 [Cyclospora cayetanensis]